MTMSVAAPLGAAGFNFASALVGIFGGQAQGATTMEELRSNFEAATTRRQEQLEDTVSSQFASSTVGIAGSGAEVTRAGASAGIPQSRRAAARDLKELQRIFDVRSAVIEGRTRRESTALSILTGAGRKTDVQPAAPSPAGSAGIGTALSFLFPDPPPVEPPVAPLGTDHTILGSRGRYAWYGGSA